MPKVSVICTTLLKSCCCENIKYVFVDIDNIDFIF